MEKFTGEISQQFTPTLPEKPSEEKKGTRFLSKLFNLESERVSDKTAELTKGSPDEKAKLLLQLSIDKVELETDIYRRAKKLATAADLPPEEVQTEVQRLRNLKDFWTEVPNNETLQQAAETNLRHKKAKEIRTAATSPADSTTENKGKTPVKTDRPRRIEINEEDITNGNVRIIDVMRQVAGGTSRKERDNLPSDPRDDAVIAKNEERLSEVNNQIQVLMQDNKAVERYNDLRHERVDLLRKVKEAAEGKRATRDLELMQERMAHQVFLEKRSYSPAEEDIVHKNQRISKAIEERVSNLASDPEVFNLLRWKQLREYQIELKKDKFAETPSRENLLVSLRRQWAEGHRVLATGPTGTGKTELFFQASKDLFGVEPERATGHELLTSYEVYGKYTAQGWEPGPLTRAIDRDRPFLFDEINAVPDNRVLMRLKTDLNVGPGQSVTIQEENGVLHKVGDGFAIGATANVKSEKHPDRKELDPAIVRMFEPLQVEYMPKNETYDLALSKLMDLRGGIKLTSKDDINALAELCQSAEWIQRAYEGYEVDIGEGKKLYAKGGDSTGKIATLKEAVLDPGKTLNMLSGWDDSRLRGMTFREHLNARIVAFIKNENFPEEDRYHLVRIFALNEFLRGVKAEELGISGLDQSVLDSWSGYKGKKIKAGSVYLTYDKVANLDPFGSIQRPAGSEMTDLLGEDETEEAVEEGSEGGLKTFVKSKNEIGGSHSELIAAVDNQYPESQYSTLNIQERFSTIPSLLLQAVQAEPGLLSAASDKIVKLLDSQPEVRAGHSAPEDTYGTFVTIASFVDKAKSEKNTLALMKLSIALDKIGQYTDRKLNEHHPSEWRWYSMSGSYSSDIVRDLKNYIQKSTE